MFAPENDKIRSHGGIVIQVGPLRVGFILAPDFTLLPFSGFVDALRMAADEKDRSRQVDCRWSIMSNDGRRVRASCGTDVKPTAPLEDPANLDYIAVVGGRVDGLSRLGRDVDRYLEAAANSQASVIGLCTGSFVLARAGLLAGHRCCVHWFHEHDFVSRFPEIPVVTDRLYLIDNKRITSPGGTSAIDLAVHLIGQHFGALRARKVVNSLSIDTARPSNSVQPHSSAAWFNRIKDNQVKRAVVHVLQNLGHRLRAFEVAKELNCSVSTLNRRFTSQLGLTVSQFVSTMRLSVARWDLLHTRTPITQIAIDTGFSSASHFIKTFSMATGMTPGEFRHCGGDGGTAAADRNCEFDDDQCLPFPDESIRDFFVIH